jgi:hypothetical protein
MPSTSGPMTNFDHSSATEADLVRVQARPELSHDGADLAIVTPIWEPRLEGGALEGLRLTSARCQGLVRIFVGPEGLPTDFYREHFPDWKIVSRDAHHFTSVDAYSASLLEPSFYELFADFSAIILCQLDAVLVKEPSPLADVDADYLGSPWVDPISVIWFRGTWLHERAIYRLLGRRLHVGNGGLSLRRPAAFIDFTNRLSQRRDYSSLRNYNEDMVISYFGPRYGLKIADREVAKSAFMEMGAIGTTKAPDVYGFHGLERLNPSLFRELVDGSSTSPIRQDEHDD